MLRLDQHLALDAKAIREPNLCRRFSERDLSAIGEYVYDGFRRDKHSRAQWEKRNEAGMDLAMQLQKAKTFPWPGCANVAFPLVTIGAMQFHARAYPTIISGTDVAKCRVIGEDAEGRETTRAERISTHMSWQCLEEDQSWEEQHDRGLLNLAIVGSNFVKTYYSASERMNVSELVLARDLVVDYFAKSVEAAPRKTQVIPLFRNDIYEKVRRGAFRNVLEEAWFRSMPQLTQEDLQRMRADARQGIQLPPEPDELTPFRGLEQHVLLDLDGDGYAEPYIVTIEESTRSVLRIVTGFDREEDIERTQSGEIIAIQPLQYYTKYGFIPSPDGGVYDIGFGRLLGPLNESVNSAINILFDTGTMSSAAGGFLGKGAKIRSGVYQFAPWGWHRIDTSGEDLRQSIFPLPVREPSQVLFSLLSLLIQYTDRISGSTDVMVGENPGQNTPAETTRTLVEQGSKIYSAIFKRVWRSMKEEFKKRYVLNSIYLEDRKVFGSAQSVILREDYLGNPNAIAPAADPNITSEGQRLVQAQGVKASAMQTPGYNVEEVERFYLKSLKVPDIDRLYPGLEKMPPGKSEKVQIAEMQLQEKQAEFQGNMQLEAAKLQLEAREMDLKAQELQIEIKLKLVELEGDVEDREVQRMNAMVSMLKSQADRFRAEADVLIAQLETMGRSAEQLKLAREQAREDAKVRADMFLKGVGARQKDRALDQKDEEIEIKRKQANKPAAAGAGK